MVRMEMHDLDTIKGGWWFNIFKINKAKMKIQSNGYRE